MRKQFPGPEDRRLCSGPPHRRTPHVRPQHETGTSAQTEVDTVDEIGPMQRLPTLHPLSRPSSGKVTKMSSQSLDKKSSLRRLRKKN
ncbi:hypothetical protein GE061_014957 [Apolygus lucorum]|uniref:Uncharacterized protein n=1 Tax=Apolygus lucorum TaxID=248454 RepID=A0A8S9XJM1_APOLU|nr:hypothetical protein GE061_014957 [Apolygus lucorum]